MWNQRCCQRITGYLVMLCLIGLAAVSQAATYVLDDHIQAAKHYMQQKQWDYAGYEWRNVLAEDPKNVQAHLGLSETLLKAGFPQDAIQHLERGLVSVKSPLLNIALGEAYAEIGQIPKATTIFLNVLTETPLEAKAILGLKKLLPKLKDAQKDTVTKRLSAQAQEAKTKTKAALDAGQYSDASRYYEVVSTVEGTRGAMNDYGLLLFLAGNKAAADQKLAALSKVTRCEMKANGAIVALSAGRAKQAQTMMEEVIGECNNSTFKPRWYNNLGYVYETQKQWSKARFSYERAIAADVTLTKAYMNLGYIYHRERDYERAIALYKTLLQREAGNAKVWNQLGFTYELHRDYKAAINAYKKAIALDPSLKEAYYNLGILYKKQSKTEEANLMFQKMADIEFSQIEQAGAQGQAKAKKPKIFEFIDLFFYDPMFS